MQFVFDLDGTICYKGKPVSETILCAMEQIESQGHEVIFASARPIRDMLPVLHERFHQHTLIGGNGALIAQKRKVVFAEAFTEKQVETLLELIKEHEATYLIDSEWNYAYTGPRDHPILRQVDTGRLAQKVDVGSLTTFVKMLLLTANNMEQLADKLASLNVVVHRHRNENVIDISPAGIDKWNALRKLGIEERGFIAFGNDANDIPMFKHAGHTVMIGHHQELAPYAAEVILAEDPPGQHGQPLSVGQCIQEDGEEQLASRVAAKLTELAR